MNQSKPHHIGRRIRLVRRSQQRLLKDIAERCGFTISLLSKIESGKVSPPIATLIKIASALGVQIGELLTDVNVQAAVFVPAAQRLAAGLTQTDKGYGFYPLPGLGAATLMQPFVFVAQRGKVKPGPMTHGGEEFVYVLEGKMKYLVGSNTYTLGPGDSLYFNSVEEHDLKPITSKVTFLAVFTATASQLHKQKKSVQ